MARVFVDTNVLAYLFDDRDATKQARAEEALRRGDNLVISTQVLLELYSVLTRKLSPPLTAEEGHQVLAGLRRWEVLGADADLVLTAARTASEHQLSIWDAMVVEAARLGGCTELWTEDLQTGAEIRGVRIVNPLA
ncbi:PIN domain-containing protein [Propioniciclava sinopodophylli]|uniref:PIN domain-containing protein n=1 Tax=Propioniciclava sinopodophylli TaxID=1837344 RepID=UPI0013F145A7|nr:PIN domain-containing protein [Propioniciclava sinopodophylli]